MKKKSKTADRHKSGFMVRLPEEYRETLLLLRDKTRRTFSSEVMLALESHFKANGVKFPPDQPKS